MINTINISLPAQLKSDADKLIIGGQYASFSDLARTAIRNLLQASKYDLWAQEAKNDYLAGRSTVLKTPEDVDRFMKRFGK